MSQYTLQIGSVYNFKLYAPAILGATYNNAKVAALLDYDSAKIIEDVTPIHASVLSVLPTGTPVNAASLIYVKIITSTGQVKVIAMDWISEQPTQVNAGTVVVSLSNVNASDLPRLRNILINSGFTQFNIQTSS